MQRAIRKFRLGLVLSFAIAAPSVGSAEYREINVIRPFELVDVSGQIRIGYLFNQRDYNAQPTSSTESEGSWEEAFHLQTRSYVYHPGFLNMIIGGGPVFIQQRQDSAGEARSNGENLFNFESRLNFLELKSYPFSIHYRQSHPSVTRGLSSRFVVEENDYGFEGFLRPDWRGRPQLSVKLRSLDSSGDGGGYTVDDSNDRMTISAKASMRKEDEINIDYEAWEHESASGSPDLPIHESLELRKILRARLANYVGGERKFKVVQRFTRQLRDIANSTTSTLDDRRYVGSVNWEINDATISNFQYRHVESQRTQTSSKTSVAELSVIRHLTEAAYVDAAIERNTQDEVGFQRTESVLRGAGTYSRDTGFGSLSVGVSLRGMEADQESAVRDISVFDEPVSLTGTTPVELANEFVVVGSVVVRNATNTQQYVEGIDYRLFTTGSLMSIQRLIGGNIADGEIVLVDYRYATSGTAEYRTVDSALTANARFFDNWSAHMRLNTFDTNVLSGNLTNRVNDRVRFEYGLGLSGLTLDGITVSAQYRHVQQDEDIAPFASESLNVTMAKNFWGRLNVSVSAAYSQTDYENSDEDVDQRSLSLVIGSRPFSNASLSYDLAYVDDVGGTLERVQLRHRLNFQWGYRLVRANVYAQFIDEELGQTARTDNRITMQLTRHF